MPPSDALLRYRPWQGTFQPPVWAAVALARASLRMLLRRKLFWALYALAALIFFFFFYGQYLVVWIQTQTANQSVPVLGVRIRVTELLKFLDRLNLNGSAHTFGNLIWFQGYICMILLALAGSILVGNDFHHGSMPFYLAKPISKRHYLLGKVLGIGAVIHLLTTVPALILYLQAGLLYDWQTYYLDHLRELVGILAYGMLLMISLGLLLTATAMWVRRTVPLVMIWAALFVLCRMLGSFLVDGQKFHEAWRLIDLWNNLYLVGLWCLGTDPIVEDPGTQPQPWQALGVIAGLGLLCLLVLRRRIQAVEILS
jgi:ABC-type transport system involved in multi-copper enzyme maturation permease subunit